jgi:hypothetical protein
MFEIFSLLSIIGVIYLVIRRIQDQNKLRLKSDMAEETGGVYLPPIKKLPEPHSVDPELRLLKDVIKTCKLEFWKSTIKIDYSIGSYLYEINIENPPGTLRIKARVRYSTDHFLKRSPARLTGFFIMDSTKGSLSYTEHSIANIICLEFLWNDYIIPHHQSEHDAHLDIYMSVRDSIKSKLVTLRRDESLENILNQD